MPTPADSDADGSGAVAGGGLPPVTSKAGLCVSPSLRSSEVTGELATSKDAHPSDGFKKYIGGKNYFSLSSVLDQCVRLLVQLLSYV